MAAELPDVHRIVTGHTPAGKATIVEDGPAPVEIRSPARMAFVLVDVVAGTTNRTPLA